MLLPYTLFMTKKKKEKVGRRPPQAHNILSIGLGPKVFSSVKGQIRPVHTSRNRLISSSWTDITTDLRSNTHTHTGQLQPTGTA